MASKLGRGLKDIFGEGLEEAIQDIQNTTKGSKSSDIDIDDIKPNPYQPRKKFDPDKLQELADSIIEHGVFTPVLVSKDVKGYVLIAGERRLRASKLAGKNTIPAIVVDYTLEQMMEIALIENIQREQLNPIEEALAFEAIADKSNFTHEQVAKKVGKSRSYVSNSIRVLTLPTQIKELVATNAISLGHAKVLLSQPTEVAKQLAKKIVANNLSVRALEALVADASLPKVKSKQKIDSKLKPVEDLIRQKLATKVSIANNQIKINFTSVKDLNRILQTLGLIE